MVIGKTSDVGGPDRQKRRNSESSEESHGGLRDKLKDMKVSTRVMRQRYIGNNA